MVKKESDILEWVEHYFKHRDLILRKIADIEKSPDKLKIKYKDDSYEEVVALTDLGSVDINKLASNTTIATLNTKKNFKNLVEKWKDFSKMKDLKIIFFNPDSELEKKWIIKPYIHSRICDEKNLKKGLKSMFETVEPVA